MKIICVFLCARRCCALGGSCLPPISHRGLSEQLGSRCALLLLVTDRLPWCALSAIGSALLSTMSGVNVWRRGIGVGVVFRNTTYFVNGSGSGVNYRYCFGDVLFMCKRFIASVFFMMFFFRIHPWCVCVCVCCAFFLFWP